MTVLKAILLGVVQGATEFFPVSSSGHLVLAQKILGVTGPELAFDVFLHLGTLLAVLLFLRSEIASVVVSLFRRERQSALSPWGRRDVLLAFVSSVPTAVIGFGFEHRVEAGIGIRGVGVAYLILTAVLLLSNLRFRHKLDPERIAVGEAAAIGVVQGLAVFPGISRSGVTITLALVLGIGASRSTKYSFFISIPAIIGAAILELRSGVSRLPGPAPAALGFVGALVVGYLALVCVERVVIRGKFIRFAPYTFLLALLSFAIFWIG